MVSNWTLWGTKLFLPDSAIYPDTILQSWDNYYIHELRMKCAIAIGYIRVKAGGAGWW
jgi:hypothetical protein